MTGMHINTHKTPMKLNTGLGDCPRPKVSIMRAPMIAPSPPPIQICVLAVDFCSSLMNERTMLGIAVVMAPEIQPDPN